LDIADLRDGRLPSLSRQPSTRHGKPVRTLTLGALRGVPAEGGLPATEAQARGKAFTYELEWRNVVRAGLQNTIQFEGAMIQVYRITVEKERLRAMPKDERVLLLLLGYASNQLSMLQKLLIFATNITPMKELEQHVTGAQTQMLVRLTVGALNETWELVRTRFIETKISRDYLNRLDSGGRKAFEALKQQFERVEPSQQDPKKLCLSLSPQRRRRHGLRFDLQ
jgi:hypothetical protein